MLLHLVMFRFVSFRSTDSVWCLADCTASIPDAVLAGFFFSRLGNANILPSIIVMPNDIEFIASHRSASLPRSTTMMTMPIVALYKYNIPNSIFSAYCSYYHNDGYTDFIAFLRLLCSLSALCVNGIMVRHADPSPSPFHGHHQHGHHQLKD